MKILLVFLLFAPHVFAQTSVNGVANQTIQQGQVFYSQSGDTIASIEAECSSLCTYVVTTSQTFTLTANHTLSSNVQLSFQAGGLWTVNGAFTLTIPGNVNGTLNQHFAGSSTITGLLGAVPVEWFGAVGFSSKTGAGAGIDYTTNIQKAINSISAGWAQLQPLCYNASSGLTITVSRVGIKGAMGRDAYPNNCVSTLVSNSATANILSVTGTSSTYLQWNIFENFSIERLVLPTGTIPTQSVGFYSQYTGGEIIDTVTSNDSLDGFYFNGTPFENSGRFAHLTCNNGLTGVNSYTNLMTINCYDIDSSNGVAMDSGEFQFVGAGVFNTAGSSTSTSVYIHGTVINDVDFDRANAAGTSYGARIIYTGSGATDSDADIHFNTPTFDNCTISCVLVNGLPTGGGSSVTIDAGYLESNTINGKIVDIESSNGVSLTNNQIFDIDGQTGNVGVYVNGSNNISIQNNKLQDLNTGVGIELVSSTNSTIVGNSGAGTSSFPWTTGISLSSTSTGNSIVANTLSGNMTTGISLDGTSLANNLVGNSINPANITTPISGTPTGTTPSYLAASSQLAPGVTAFASGTAGLNSNCISYSGPGGSPNNTFLCSIVSVQSEYGVNVFYNGTNWQYQNNGPAIAERLEGGGTLAFYDLAICPNGTAGGSITAMDTTCVAEWIQNGSSGASAWINPGTASPTFPSNGAFAVNPTANFYVDFSGNAHATSVIPSNGFTGTKTAGSCVLTITSGIITNVTGC